MKKTGIFLSLTFLTIFLVACSGRGVLSQEQDFVERVIHNNPNIQNHRLKVGEHILHYATNGEKNKPALIIIHGTPSTWEQYARYLLNDRLLDHYRMVVIDRPGWGDSVLGQNKPIASFEEQASIISVLATKLRQESGGQPVVLMGHSLGASLAPRIAMDYPDLIDGLLLLAGTFDPALADPRWYHYLAAVPLVKYIIGDSLHRSNKEMFSLPKDISAMKSRWDEIQIETIAVQGMKDFLVFPANSQFIEQTFDSDKTNVVRLEDEGHLFPMTRRDDVVNWSLELLKRIEKDQPSTL